MTRDVGEPCGKCGEVLYGDAPCTACDNDAPDAQITDLPPDVQPLATTLMLASARDNLSVANSLTEGYKAERDRAWAELTVIRTAITGMLSKDWMPNPDRIRAALYPSDWAINLRMEKDA